MSDNTIKNFISRLQDLNVQRVYAEDTLEEITQEVSRAEYRLRIAHAIKRHNRQAVQSIIRPGNNKNSFMIGDLVRITNKCRRTKKVPKGKQFS